MPHQVDQINFGLILLSAALAYFFPLELFLLAYAILGPLHYLTEINWLHQKSYFVDKSKMVWLILAVFASLLLFLPPLYFEYGNPDSAIFKWFQKIQPWANSALLFCFIMAFALQIFQKKAYWIVSTIVALIGAYALKQHAGYSMLVGALLPTIIHVYVFTILFMWFGAAKAKSKWGFLSIVAALIVPFVFVVLPLMPEWYLFSDELIELYEGSNFHITPYRISQLLGLGEGADYERYANLEIKLMMFVAFSYVYHYLNWFSKTTVIQWHKQLNQKRSLAIILIWIVSIGLYGFDFRLGFMTSLFLSFLHVILEFPLNAMSIKGLIKG